MRERQSVYRVLAMLGLIVALLLAGCTTGAQPTPKATGTPPPASIKAEEIVSKVAWVKGKEAVEVSTRNRMTIVPLRCTIGEAVTLKITVTNKSALDASAVEIGFWTGEREKDFFAGFMLDSASPDYEPGADIGLFYPDYPERIRRKFLFLGVPRFLGGELILPAGKTVEFALNLVAIEAGEYGTTIEIAFLATTDGRTRITSETLKVLVFPPAR